MLNSTKAVIFERFYLEVDNLLDEEIPDEIIKAMTKEQFQKLANRVSNIMFATLSDAVHQACREQGFLPIIEEE